MRSLDLVGIPAYGSQRRAVRRRTFHQDAGDRQKGRVFTTIRAASPAKVNVRVSGIWTGKNPCGIPLFVSMFSPLPALEQARVLVDEKITATVHKEKDRLTGTDDFPARP